MFAKDRACLANKHLKALYEMLYSSKDMHMR